MNKKSARVRKKLYSPKKKKVQSITLYTYRYIVIAGIVIAILIAGINIFQSRHNFRVLGAATYLADTENSKGGDSNNSSGDTVSQQDKPDKPEATDAPEPTDVPEVHQQVEQVHQEVDKQVEQNNLQSVEVQPPQEGSQTGKVILQQQGNTTQELQTPTSTTTPVTQIINPQAGTVSVHVAGPNNITISNGPYTISTQYPVVINPQDQTMAIKTPNGVTVIKTFPSQVFQNAQPANKLSSVSSINLTDQQGTPVYQANGIQIRKFLGIIPIKATVQEQINAQTGQVINFNLPWYYSLFGFVFQST